MPRKTIGHQRSPRGRAGFNEAAARCRGKPIPMPKGFCYQSASMRPRPDAAENVQRALRTLALGRLVASMRPRPDAAENFLPRGGAAGRVQLQ